MPSEAVMDKKAAEEDDDEQADAGGLKRIASHLLDDIRFRYHSLRGVDLLWLLVSESCLHRCF